MYDKNLSQKLAITSDLESALVLEIKESKDICKLNYDAYNLAVIGQFDLVKKLISFRNSFWSKNLVDYTPLMRAINEKMSLEFIQKLVECGDPISFGMSDDGYTALDYAYRNGNGFEDDGDECGLLVSYGIYELEVFEYLYEMSELNEGLTVYNEHASKEFNFQKFSDVA